MKWGSIFHAFSCANIGECALKMSYSHITGKTTMNYLAVFVIFEVYDFSNI